MADTTDPTHPDFKWVGDTTAASTDDLANAVAHVKAWFARELDRIKGAAAAPTPAPVAPQPPVVAPVPMPTDEPANG